ncbi:GGDEF domain-containing protein [uncultured Sphingomonas sp.]|uniref:GGDEF domain-containing protein n=1 Tax=uncultured Sphingomonas sp. TaxID=158754 RepID=UPI0025F1F8AC|nr:GGDEF domain-containing protein [uncultured Sphingomonas sp.]
MSKVLSGTRRSASPVTRVLIHFVESSARLTPRNAAMIVFACLFVTIGVDYLAEGLFNPHLALFFTTFLAAWSISELAGLGCAAVATCAVMAVNGPAYGLQASHPHMIAIVANSLGRLLMLSWFALLASALRAVVEQERWRASIDELTGALNKYALRERMSGLVDMTRRSDGAIVLAYMDLDGFKGVNDRHGHSAGDRVLKTFAHGARDAMRSYDLLARIGGDEFVAVLAVRSAEEGDRVAERLHAQLSDVLKDSGFPVTCSMGALVADAQGIAEDDYLIEAADQLMYEVKRSGKNALRIARANKLGLMLRSAYEVQQKRRFNDLLRRVDHADLQRNAA